MPHCSVTMTTKAHQLFFKHSGGCPGRGGGRFYAVTLVVSIVVIVVVKACADLFSLCNAVY